MTTSTSTPASGSSDSTGEPTQLRLHLSRLRDYGVPLFLLLIIVALSIATPSTFLTVTNFKNVLVQSVPIGMIASIGTIVLVCGGFDLSAGAIFAVAAVVGVRISNDATPVIGIAAGLVAGALLGLFNGLITTVGRINPFVGTLATMIGYGGLATLLTGSGLILINDPSFSDIANTHIFGFQIASWLLVGVALLCGFLLNWTVFGQRALNSGSNVFAARLSGIPINRTLITAYTLSGTIAALAGLIVTGESLSVSPNAGEDVIFSALAAILIGGNSIWGGQGAIWRTMVGTFIITLFSDGFNLLGVNPLYQDIVSGALILIAVGSDAWIRRAGPA